MNENEEVTPQQLVIIRQLCDNEKLDAIDDESFERNVAQLVQQGLAERNEKRGVMGSTKGLELLTESGLLPPKNESRAEEVVRMYGKILRLEKVLTDIEKLDARQNLTVEQKFQQTLGLIRHSRIESTF